MDLVAKFGREDLAILYVVKNQDKYLEFVESLQPPIPREKKWVLILSTMYGCPVRCKMCDAGTYYQGKVSAEDLIKQIDFMVENRYPDKVIPADKFKVQFARMGEPCLNPAVLDVLQQLPGLYHAPGLMPCISTIAPSNAQKFMDELAEIKHELYDNGHFQMQFSIHTTDEDLRKEIIPYKIWTLEEIAIYGEQFYETGDRKITLNFAAEKDTPLDPEVIARIFDPKKYLIKITPINPTESVKAHGISSMITMEEGEEIKLLIKEFEDRGFEALISIGELEENKIGSNCGQHALKFMDGKFEMINYQPYGE
jgi:23S rRNA (adenine2503-C2)-methyltransferase